MPWRYVSRSDLLEHLERAELSAAGIDDLRRWLRDVLVDADLEVDEAAAPLIHASVERLDVASDNDGALRQLAADLYRLIRAVPNEDLARDLIPLIEERDRTVDLLERVLDGRISRTAFLSYVTERCWPTAVKDRMARMDSSVLQQLHDILTSRAYERLPVLLSNSDG